MKRADILEAAQKCVCGQREQDYGKPEDNFRTIADFWGTYKGVDFSAEDVAIMMALMKIARIKTGTGTDDCYIDLAGYAACGGEISSQEESPDASEDEEEPCVLQNIVDSFAKMADFLSGKRKSIDALPAFKNPCEKCFAIDFDDIGKARSAILDLDRIIDEYGYASVADLLDLKGCEPVYSDTKIGWTKHILYPATFHRTYNGKCIVTLPSPINLDDKTHKTITSKEETNNG